MLPIQQGLTNVNYNSRGTNPTWIVLHYTANNGDTAANNISYFKSVNRGASANYFVDESSIWQCVKDTDTAWHVGNDWYNNAARNTNSIGIEMCSRKHSASSTSLETYYLKDETVMNAVKLTKYLMKKYNIPISRVCRHYDVTGKYCPAPMVYNNGTITWGRFIQLVETEEDMTKAETQALIDSTVKPLQTQLASANTELAALRKTYAFLEDVPEWYRDAVQYYVDKCLIKGKGDKNGKPFLDLTATECRLITLMYRAETGIELPEEPEK